MQALRVIALTIVVSGASALVVSQLFGQVEGIAYVPLTIERTQQTLGVDGSIEERVVEAVRADGSTVRVTQARRPDGTLLEFRNIVDLSSGRKTAIALRAKSTTTTFLTNDQVRYLRERRLSCPGNAEWDPILGHDVVSNTRDLTGSPPESFRLVTRYAPALGCVTLDEVLKKIETDGSERIVKYSQVVRIEPGDPDPALFAVPADYAEMSPAEYAARSGSANTENPIVRMMESAYRANRPSPIP